MNTLDIFYLITEFLVVFAFGAAVFYDIYK
jgi:hypothetical protein